VRNLPVGLSSSASVESPSDVSTLLEVWMRSADAAAAAHQIRNRLQSIIIEAALLKRAVGVGEQNGLARVRALAQDGAGLLEVFGELVPCPELSGSAPLESIVAIATELDVPLENKSTGISIAVRKEALAALMTILVNEAIVFRGFRATRMVAGAINDESAEVVIELETNDPADTSRVVTPWMTTLQMARDVGGSLELHSGEPPIVKLRLPRG
jgi:hypothetical protein